MPLLPKTTLYGCAVLATLAISLPQPRGDGKVSMSLSLDAPSSVNDINDFTIAGKLKNEGTQDILVVKDPSGILYDFFTADALVIERTASQEKDRIQPSFVGYRAKWDIKSYLDNNIEEEDFDDESDILSTKTLPNGRRAYSDSGSSDPSSDSDESHRLWHADTGLTGFSEQGNKKYPPGTTLALPAGETTTFNYKVGDVYDFSKSGAGAYTFKLKRNFIYVLVDDKIDEVKMNVKGSNAFKIQGKLKGEVPKPRNHARAIDHSDDGTELDHSLVKRAGSNRVTTVGCGPRQISVIDQAAKIADEYAKESNSYVSAMTGPTPRYQQWFGVWDWPTGPGTIPPLPYVWPPRQRVSNMFETLVNHSFLIAGDAGGYTYDCSCQQTIYAFVKGPIPGPSASNPAIIHLCTKFRARDTPMQGTDSKAGTLIHEATHAMYHVPSAMDHAYGHSASQQLIQFPYWAATNADNYEYFAENHPPLA